MSRLSVVVTAYNEEENIKRCLSSVKFADEVVVVDNESEDATAKIAKEFADKSFSQKNNPDQIDIQKNFGFEKASGDWILSLDADEQITRELALEIRKIVSKNDKRVSGYWIPRKNFIFDKWIEHSGWYPDYQLRLFRKGEGKYTKKHVHEDLEIAGETAKLKEHIYHYNYKTIAQFMAKHLGYAQNEADSLLDKGYEFSYFDAIRFPLSEFLGRFFARKGYRDGYHGLMLALLMAFYHLVIFTLIWEKKGFKEYEGDNFLKEAENEFKKSGREILYWFSKEKIENIKNPLRKAAIRISERLKTPKL